MEQQHGPWRIKGSRTAYEDGFITVVEDAVTKPTGEEGTYATVQLKSGAAVLPMDKAGNVYLTRQFRYAIGKYSIEAISGGIEEGETPLQAAQRETKEELGIEGTAWTELGFFHLETSIIKGPVYLFVLRNLEFTDTDPDDTEDLTVLKISLEEAVQKVLNSEITHGPSCMVLLKTYVQQKAQL